MPHRYVQQNPYLRNGNRTISIGNRATNIRPNQSMHYPQVPRGLPRAYDPRIRDFSRGQVRPIQSNSQFQMARRPFAPVQKVEQKKPGFIGSIFNYLLTPPKRNTAPKRKGFVGNWMDYERRRRMMGF